MFCAYKNILGKPSEGFHETRLFGLAMNDVIGAVIIGFLISYYFKLKLFYVYIYLTIFIILIHKLFCVDTALNVLIFGKH